MIPRIIDFINDYFTNINTRKIVSGILVVIGFGVVSKVRTVGDVNTGLLVGSAGILIGGAGLVVIYYDMAKDKLSRGYDELGTLAKAIEQKEHVKKEVSSWHFNQDASTNRNQENTKPSQLH